MRSKILVQTLFLVSFSQTANAQNMGTVCIDSSYMVSGSTRSVEVYDVVAGKGLGTFTVSAGSDVCMAAQKSDAGFMRVNYRVNGGSTVQASWLKDGEKFAR